ncbi:hybrid sensor histidine kinase/response regulator [Rubrivivax sp. RP6-9]|uniref:hybrid sensor histidine kinase/response regulator n=1 Tax=Rubrivivax sp. RP6-9 TaxID=3415750 RepID=UPI003CC57B96
MPEPAPTRWGGSQEHGLTELKSWRRHLALERAARDIGMRLGTPQREHVAREQLRMVLLHTRFGTLAATAFAVLLALQVQHSLPALQVQGWLAAKLVVALARIVLAQAYVRWGDTSPQRRRWEHAMLGMLALDGLVWGLAGWRLAGEDVPLAALGVAALDGVSCIATFGLQVRLAATAAYVVPMLLPMAWGLAVRSDDIAHFAAGGQLLLLALLLATARATSQRLAMGLLLRQQADQLVAEKDAALQLARERSAERDRFLAKVSHELRTPLHGILGLARLMHLEAQAPAALRRLELIESSGLHLQGLINDLLEASVIDAGAFVLHAADFDLAAELDQLAEVTALRAADKGLQFTLQSTLPRPCWVRGDAARVRQVLQNLLGNAVKFTVRGGVTLQAAPVPGPAPGGVRLSVRDTGPGMDAAELARVFQPFQQAGKTRIADGVGLGLTIARELAIAMGGNVTAESAPGAGAVFHFDALLPPAPAPTTALVPLPAGTAAGPALPGLVLVAEDDEVNALIVGAFLDGLGVRNERVADGQQAVLRALRDDDRPDLVLMDCRMPVLDGLAATREIRRQERLLGLPRLPILALTAADADTDRAACLGAGMDRVIGKPFTRDQLVQALHAAGQPRPPPAAPPSGPRHGAAPA